MRRNIMRKFEISEISGVDVPCQEGATAAFFKRGAPAAKPGEDSMSPEIKKSLGLAETATDAEVAAAITKNAETLAKAQADAAEALKKSTLSDETRAHYADLAKKDEKAAKDFLDKDEEARKAEVAKAKAGDETFTSVDGAVISKRAVGDSVYSILKGQDARIKAQGEEIAKAAEATQNAEIRKRAAVEFPHLAGSEDDRFSVLKYLAKAPDDVRKAADAIFKAAEASAKFAFSKAGRGAAPGEGPGGDSPEAKLNALAKRHQDANAASGMSFEKAYDAVLSTPEGAALYEKMSALAVD